LKIFFEHIVKYYVNKISKPTLGAVVAGDCAPVGGEEAIRTDGAVLLELVVPEGAHLTQRARPTQQVLAHRTHTCTDMIGTHTCMMGLIFIPNH